MQCNFFSVSII